MTRDASAFFDDGCWVQGRPASSKLSEKAHRSRRGASSRLSTRRPIRGPAIWESCLRKRLRYEMKTGNWWVMARVRVYIFRRTLLDRTESWNERENMAAESWLRIAFRLERRGAPAVMRRMAVMYGKGAPPIPPSPHQRTSNNIVGRPTCTNSFPAQ